MKNAVQCPMCGEWGEPGFEVCWKCGASLLDDQPELTQEVTQEVTPEPSAEHPSPPLEKRCAACGAELESRGEIPIRTRGPDEGMRIFREYRELSEKLWPVEVYACPTCGLLALYEPN